MDALLLQKAEIQQSLVMTSKNLEKTKQQAKVHSQNKFQFLLRHAHNDTISYFFFFYLHRMM